MRMHTANLVTRTQEASFHNKQFTQFPKKKSNFIFLKITNISAFSEVWQQASVLEEGIGAPY